MSDFYLATSFFAAVILIMFVIEAPRTAFDRLLLLAAILWFARIS